MSAAVKARFGSILGETVEAARTVLGYAPVDACLGGGLRLAALHEVFPVGANEAAASVFALVLAARTLGSHKWLLWVRQDFSALENGEIHAAGLPELGLDPRRVLMLRAPDAVSALRAGTEGLNCKGLGATIIETWGRSHVFDLVASRRLTLAAQQHGVAAIALRFGADPEPSAAETRWLVRAGTSPPDNEDWEMPVFDAALVRNRHGACGRWVMEWDCNNGLFCATHSRDLVAASFDGPAEAAMEGFRQAG